MAREMARGIDLERVVIVPIFFLLLAWSVWGALRVPLGLDSAGETIGVALLAYQVLLIAFYVMLIWLLLTRAPAVGVTHRWLPRVLAYVATFASFLLVFMPAGLASSPIAWTAVGLMLLGEVFSVYSVWFLGRSFSLAPQARTLVDRGPYRWVRHPLYVGEIVTLFGAALFRPAPLRFVLVAVIAALQVYRAHQEERVLAQYIQEYAEYQARTHRFVPGLF